MSESGEMRGFVTAVVFIVLFSALVATMPLDMQGEEATPALIVPLDPSLVSDFAEAENFTKAAFSGVAGLYYIYNDLGGNDWECDYYASSESFSVGALVRVFGVIWLGGLSYCEFVNDDGVNLGTTVTFADILYDAVDGAARYDLIFEDNGNSAGGFIFYWNTSVYSDPSDAWDNEDLILLHGFGFENTAPVNVATLLLQLLFLQLPDTPVLINLLIATPLWAMIIFIIWFIFIKSTPFLG